MADEGRPADAAAREDDDSQGMSSSETGSPVHKKDVTPEEAAEAVRLKDEGNKMFKERHFAKALDFYTQSIDLNPDVPAVLCNRALMHLKLDCAGAALQDANRSIALDPSFVKAYYRKATAHELLGKIEQAFKDYKRVVQLRPSDADAQKKFKDCEKEVKRIRFQRAISSPDDPVLCDVFAPGAKRDWTRIQVDASYSGPLLDPAGPTVDFVRATMQHFKEEKQLPQSHVRGLLCMARQVFLKFPNIVPINVPEGSVINVCGDIHGQFYDLCHLLELGKEPSPTNLYLFNGDFVDRGSYGVECFLTLLCWKVLFPQHFFMARGNHESKNLQRVYGFEGELNSKLGGGEELFDQFHEVFNTVPCGHVINNAVFVVHGGLFSKKDVTIADINKEFRLRELPEEGSLHEMLWSDPHAVPNLEYMPSKRGAGVSFGVKITKHFLENNKLDYMIRSHEVKDDGYEVQHDGKLITVFSAPNYCDTIGNKAAFITLRPEDGLKPKYTQFEAQKHPGKKPMQYSRFFS